MYRPDAALAGRIYLKRVGAGLCHQPDVREVYTVRTKDVSRIVGVDDSRIKYIYEHTRASVGVMVDLTAMRHYNAHIEVSGTREEVGLAVQMIEEAIREIYDENSARLAMTSEYLHHEAIEIPFPKAMYVLNDVNLIEIESESLTWIEVDVSRPHRVGRGRQLEILICGTRQNVGNAIRLIRQREDQVREPEGPGAVDRACTYLWGRAKAACW